MGEIVNVYSENSGLNKLCIHKYVHMHTYAYTCLHIHTHTYMGPTWTHIYTHIHIMTCEKQWSYIEYSLLDHA